MNKTKLKSYAPQARKDFIAAVTARANLLGLSEKGGRLEVLSSQPQGDTTVIAGQAWPVKVHSQRQQLIARIQKDGFAQTMEAVAYTWFNRFAALRYMELHDYLGHGLRALSSQEGTLPDILTHAADLAQKGAGNGGLPGLKPEVVVEMKLSGNRDGELYRLLLVAQCNALSNVMPFLFERIDDETELLLPDNLLRTDSVIAKLVSSIAEEDWGQVEIIGWLYQFYISDKKDEVIGRVVKSEDIPAATQLFTPNWIVQYLVQNSVGRLWLMADPTSTLKAQWPYYIEPASQTEEAQARLEALVHARVNEDGETLNPESITLLDPACGSGHILVEAYEVFKVIYLERGYQPRTIPRLILEKNLFGLDIDDRAAQMAGFAILMKARADDRRLFNEPIKLNVLALQESKGLNADVLARALQTVVGQASSPGETIASISGFGDDDLFPGTRPQSSLGESIVADTRGDLAASAIATLISTFSDAKTFGSLIQISPALNAQLPLIEERLQLALFQGDLYAKAAAEDLWPLVAQARLLGRQFDAIAANPPYMGGKGMHLGLKALAAKQYERGKSDLFAMFMERGLSFCKPLGMCGMVTMQSWMFLSSYETLRNWILDFFAIDSLVQIGYNSFPELNSKIAQACAFVLTPAHALENGTYLNLNDTSQSADKGAYFLEKKLAKEYELVDYSSFKAIPGSPIAHWVSKRIRGIFKENLRLGDVAKPRQGLASGDNDRFMRYWHEVSWMKIGLGFCDYKTAKSSGNKWFPHNKGGEFRKWYGNLEYVLAFDGENFQALSELGNHLPSRQLYFKEGMTWTALTSGNFNGRYTNHAIFDAKGPVLFANEPSQLMFLIGFCNSTVATACLKILAPTLDFNQGPVGNLPVKILNEHDGLSEISTNVSNCISLAKKDWDKKELSLNFDSCWDIHRHPLNSLSECWNELNLQARASLARCKELEERNNRIFINAYGLQDELSPEVLESQITLARPDREKDCQRLISYAIGCMMGRYSLDAPGLIYANSGNVGFDSSRYASFPADGDGIVPLTDELWFDDEAASRIREFLLAVWGDTLVENMVWLAESLGAKAGETPDETIRRYLADKFYKDHLQTYKKRPIYWLFSSGKQGAFQALVYLHRYHEGTLARMRAEYVVPLTGKIQSRIDMLEKDVMAATSTAARNKLTKEVERLKKKHVELLAYDEQLRHFADMRITLNLDDGVKVNYGKFGDLLAEVRTVAGSASDD